MFEKQIFWGCGSEKLQWRKSYAKKIYKINYHYFIQKPVNKSAKKTNNILNKTNIITTKW